VGAGDDPAERVVTLMKLGIGKCKLCLQAPKAMGATDPAVFAGKRIVTSFPAIARKFFDGLEAKDKENGSFSPPERSTESACRRTKIREVSGSVEAACGLGLADAVVDLVETGTTMHAAGLEVVGDPIFESEFLLFQQLPSERNGLDEGPKADTVKTILSRLQGYLTATRYVMVVYNCHDDNLAACCGITPGKKSPTVTELKEEGWHSVSSLVQKSVCNSIMDKLTKAGASDILCLPLQNTRM
jgi:ATP phosphoribosyltransferase